ncbi:hypothetical protein LCGC14_2489490 [marine sediment metagenome]|uniref:SRP54-type proteins GTP-binding domain-containing protein n=1 Tax=marine sediment metagenome TaxID=412755 RepID=A0A0F9B593_9ZZZZ
MLEKLSEILRKATDRIANAIFLDKNIVDSIIRDLQRALIEADVNILLVKEISDRIRKSALDERIKGLEKKEHIIKLLHDELSGILGEYRQLKLQKKQNRIMFLGLYGAGKTTTVAKLGNYFSKRGNKVALVGLDTHRLAAAEQLKQLAEKHKLSYFIEADGKNPLKIWKKYEKKLKDFNVVLIDTAGRMHTAKNLLKEIEKIVRVCKPDVKIFVGESITGNDAIEQAKSFNWSIGIDGIILTKADIDEKGGTALSVGYVTKKPILYLGTGQEHDAIEVFDKKKFIKRLGL